MMDREHLHLLINEDIYLLPQEEKTLKLNKEQVSISEITANEHPEITPDSKQIAPEESEKEVPEETPKIPELQPIREEVAPPVQKPIPLAVFHESDNDAEIGLLQKIINACKIPEENYQVFANGFNQEVLFDKALVFVAKAKAFYAPIPYKGSQFLCSKPLSVLINDQQEKAKLWAALQKFVG